MIILIQQIKKKEIPSKRDLAHGRKYVCAPGYYSIY